MSVFRCSADLDGRDGGRDGKDGTKKKRDGMERAGWDSDRGKSRCHEVVFDALESFLDRVCSSLTGVTAVQMRVYIVILSHFRIMWNRALAKSN